MLIFYIIVTLAILQGIGSLVDGARAAKHIRTFRPKSGRRSSVVVFCPCKGVDDEFDKNIRSILAQECPNYRAVFIVESQDDAAYAVLKGLNATVLVAGVATTRGQKVHNLIHAVESEISNPDVFVFCDADARFPHDWLSNLVAPLDDESVAVSTGYRWYVAEENFPTILRSTWNASIVTQLGSHSRNFAWGGSMALRRETFHRINVRAAWDGAVSDDYAITRAARAAGMRIVFVPTCLIPSYGHATWADLLEFTTRQIIITRVYQPRVWRVAFVSQTIFNLAFWWSLFVAPALCAVIYVLAALKGRQRLRAVDTVLPSRALSKARWSYILLAPLTALLYEYNMIRSALTRDILWRQIRYSMISPHRTVVRRGAGGS